jgi:hypothetical protein
MRHLVDEISFESTAYSVYGMSVELPMSSQVSQEKVLMEEQENLFILMIVLRVHSWRKKGKRQVKKYMYNVMHGHFLCNYL